MVKVLYVPKRFGNYADLCMMLGIAKLVESALEQIGAKKEITIIDQGTLFKLEFKTDVDIEKIATSVQYRNLFPPVKGAKTDISDIPEEVKPFDTVEETKQRKLYRDYLYQKRKNPEIGEEEIQPSKPQTQNGVILTSMRHDRNHNSLWEGAWQLQEHWGAFVALVIEGFSKGDRSFDKPESEIIAELFHKRTRLKLPPEASAVKIYIPTSVQGVNRPKADSNKSTDSQKMDWLTLYLIAGGLFEFGLAERVKVAEGTYDWRVVVLNPQKITLERYSTVLDELRKRDPPGGGHGIARFDAELVLKFCRDLLNYHLARTEQATKTSRSSWKRTIRDDVSGFSGTHFGSKGQVYGVKVVFSLGLPSWIKPTTRQEIQHFQKLLREHLIVIQSLSAEDGHSELLAAYRDFITGTELRLFFPFQVLYADHVIKQIASSKNLRPRLFSRRGLDIMIESFSDPKKRPLSDITNNSGFQRIAKAINFATVKAGEVWVFNSKGKAYPKASLESSRFYGLSQRLSGKASSRNEFVSELAAFLGEYEAENLRLEDKLDKIETLGRTWTHKNDLDEIIKLIDEFKDTALIANLLIAYGYANWTEAKEDRSLQPLTNNTENQNETNEEQGDSDND